jgi:DNA-binding CsgD family transcriptional regulator
MPESAGIRPAAPAGAVLAEYAPELYEDLRLMPLLRRLMNISCCLTEAVGGSISIVECPGQRYTKIAERGTACRLGQSFPLHEGVTGQVMTCRRPVVLDAYRDIATGHLPLGHPARDGAVAAIPIWWRGEVVGVNVVFAGCARPFTTAEIDQLEVVTQLAAPGITTAAGHELSLAYLGQREPLPADGVPGPVAGFPDRHRGDTAAPSVAEVALELTALGERAGIYRDGRSERLNVAVVREGGGLHLLTPGRASDLREVGRRPIEPAGWNELVDTAGGTDVRPYSAAVDAAAPGRGLGVEDGPVRSPFSPRERQVATLLARGLSDRSIAHELLISPKTVEKHVGAVLRKTGTSSRTAAVMCALERGWLDDEASAVRLSPGEIPPSPPETTWG